MEKFKNATLDSVAIVALGSGVALIPTDLVKGLVLVLVGAGLSFLKYYLRGE